MIGDRDLEDSIGRYVRAWGSPGTGSLNELFTQHATYSPAPYAATIRGRSAIAAFWEQEREGPDEPFELSSEIAAVDGRTGIARLEVHYAGPPVRDYRNLWIVTRDEQGRCEQAEEWPSFPGQPRTAQGAYLDADRGAYQW